MTKLLLISETDWLSFCIWWLCTWHLSACSTLPPFLHTLNCSFFKARLNSAFRTDFWNCFFPSLFWERKSSVVSMAATSLDHLTSNDFISQVRDNWVLFSYSDIQSGPLPQQHHQEVFASVECWSNFTAIPSLALASCHFLLSKSNAISQVGLPPLQDLWMQVKYITVLLHCERISCWHHVHFLHYFLS